MKLIDKSKGKFSIDSFVSRITDSAFVNNDKYIDLIIKIIPPKKYFDTAFEIYRLKSDINNTNLKAVYKKLLKKFTDDEKNEIIDAASEELRFTESDSVVTRNVAIFQDSWTLIAEDAKIRAENKLLNCLKNAEDSNNEVNSDGVYSSWLSAIVDSLSLKNEFANIIYNKLSSNDEGQQRFVIRFFGDSIEDFHDPIFNNLAEIINEQLKNGNKVIYDFVVNHISNDEINKEIEEAMKSFKDSDAEFDLSF